MFPLKAQWYVAGSLNYVLILIHWVAQSSKITNTVLLLKHIFHDFSAFEQLSISNVRMSEGTFCHVEVHISLVDAKHETEHQMTHCPQNVQQKFDLSSFVEMRYVNVLKDL